jgi:hypothetical protein
MKFTTEYINPKKFTTVEIENNILDFLLTEDDDYLISEDDNYLMQE